MTRLNLLTFSAAMLSDPAYAAQSDVITHLSEVKPSFDRGVLAGCVVNYVVSHPIDEFDQTKRTFVSGEIQFRKSRLGPVLFLKVNPKSIGSKATKPVIEAYLLNGLKSNISDFATSAPDGTNRVTLFNAKEATLAAILDAVRKTGSITIGYSVREGGNLSLFQIDLKTKLASTQESSAIEFDRTAPSRWTECVVELLSTEQ